VESILPAYIFLGKNQVGEEIEVRLFEEGDSPKEKYALLESVIFRLIDEIMDVAKPFVPTDDLKVNCPSCAFHSVCGTQWVRGRAYA
jgi:hypothetical protein